MAHRLARRRRLRRFVLTLTPESGMRLCKGRRVYRRPVDAGSCLVPQFEFLETKAASVCRFLEEWMASWPSRGFFLKNR